MKKLLTVCIVTALAAILLSAPDPVLLAIPKTGQVLHTTTTTAIFWGSAWNDSEFAGDIVSGMDTFFDGFGGSHFAQIATEYYDKVGQVTPFSTYRGHVVDASEPPPGVLSDATVIAEACRIINNAPEPNGIYFVYTSTSAALSGGLCARRTWGTCGRRDRVMVVYAPRMTGLDAPCDDAQDTGVETGHSVALGQYGRVTGNKLMTAITDPWGTGWVDKFGNEITNKCSGVYPPPDSFGLFSNGSLWKMSAKWSNAAYRAGTGLPNAQGQRGCVY